MKPKNVFLLIALIILIFTSFSASLAVAGKENYTNTHRHKHKPLLINRYNFIPDLCGDRFTFHNGSDSEVPPFFHAENEELDRYIEEYENDTSCKLSLSEPYEFTECNKVFNVFSERYKSVVIDFFERYLDLLKTCNPNSSDRHCISIGQWPISLYVSCRNRFVMEYACACGKNVSEKSVSRSYYLDKSAVDAMIKISKFSKRYLKLINPILDTDIQCDLLYNNDKLFGFIYHHNYINGKITRETYIKSFIQRTENVEIETEKIKSIMN